MLTTEDLRPLGYLSTAFYGLPSLTVWTFAGGFSLHTRFALRLCAVTVWVDGVRQDVGYLQTFLPADLIALEYYARAGLAPLRYQSGEDWGCGIVLAWTRDLR